MMKKIMVGFVFLLSTGFYLSNLSCNRHDYSKQLVLVDSLAQVANDYLSNLNKLDSSAIMDMDPLVKTDLEWLGDSLTKESLKKSSHYLSTLKITKKLVEIFPREFSVLKQELNKSLQMLDDLKKDLKNGSIDEIEAIKYTNDEVEAMEIISEHYNKLFGRLDATKDYLELRSEFYEREHTSETN
jgi:hypothetical protein